MPNEERFDQIDKKVNSVKSDITEVKNDIKNIKENHLAHICVSISGIEEQNNILEEGLNKVRNAVSFIKGSLWVAIPFALAMFGALGWIIVLLVEYL